MRRLLLLLALLAGPVAADPPGMAARFRIAGQDQLQGQVEGWAGPVFGGLSGGTLDDPRRAGEIALYVGLRPEMPRSQVELRIVRPIDAAPALRVTLGRRLGIAELATRLAIEPEAASGNASASLGLSPRTRLAAEIGARHGEGADAATLRLAATRRIAPGSALDLSLSEASNRPPRAALGLSLAF